jgi:hypothetical protein
MFGVLETIQLEASTAVCNRFSLSALTSQTWAEAVMYQRNFKLANLIHFPFS